MEENKVSSKIMSTYAEYKKKKGPSCCFVCQIKKVLERLLRNFTIRKQNDNSIPQQLLT
jgi:hypothetical protein